MPFIGMIYENTLVKIRFFLFYKNICTGTNKGTSHILDMWGDRASNVIRWNYY